VQNEQSSKTIGKRQRGLVIIMVDIAGRDGNCHQGKRPNGENEEAKLGYAAKEGETAKKEGNLAYIREENRQRKLVTKGTKRMWALVSLRLE
jgi:hypothetical protein